METGSEEIQKAIETTQNSEAAQTENVTTQDTPMDATSTPNQPPPKPMSLAKRQFYVILDGLFAQGNNDIQTYKFYGIDFEAALVSHKSISYPCEVGISEFTIDGLESSFLHRVIDSRPYPRGRQQTVSWVIDNVHGIDETWFSEEHTDYEKIWKDITAFTKDAPFLLANNPSTEISCFNWLAREMEIENHFQVYDVVDLMEYLNDNVFKVKEMCVPLPEPLKFHSYLPDVEISKLCKCYRHGRARFSYWHCALEDARMVGASLRKASEMCSFVKNEVCWTWKQHIDQFLYDRELEMQNRIKQIVLEDEW
eukprot:TRINITY_DN2106_c0_g1_i2.p1 TRINITY_DN2106_c0_g1~~TRINITY_DN2106_c0_g1_i2.p1  ORF type:complete len:310 (+),score=60.64 TRINITY_DN2106_c0_g1_i2:94-1023(+)